MRYPRWTPRSRPLGARVRVRVRVRVRARSRVETPEMDAALKAAGFQPRPYSCT